MAAAQGSSFLMQFGASVFLARLLTPYEMGVFAVGAAIVGALGLLQAFGLQSMIVREENLTEDVIATAFSLNALICVSIAIAIAGLSFLGGLFLKDPGVQKVLLVLAISPLLEIFDFLPAAQLERGARFKAISIVNTIRGLVTSVVTVGLAVLGFKYMSIAYAQVTAQAVAVGLTCWIGRDFIRLRFGFKAFRGAARFGLQMLAIFGVSDLGRRSSEIIMARIQQSAVGSNPPCCGPGAVRGFCGAQAARPVAERQVPPHP